MFDKSRHRRSMSRALLRATGRRRETPTVAIEAILASLGDRSFGWAILFFAMLNMVPLPPGSTLVLAVPLLLITPQMALGAQYMHLPQFVTRRQVPCEAIKRGIVRLKPLIRPIERILKPRRLWMFTPARERLIGVMLFVVSVALFIPLPLSGFLPAFSLFVSALALLERDGLVMMIGLGLGATSIAVTIGVIAVIVAGLDVVF